MVSFCVYVALNAGLNAGFQRELSIIKRGLLLVITGLLVKQFQLFKTDRIYYGKSD